MRLREYGRIEALPQACLLVAEGRNPAFGGYAGAGEDDDASGGAHSAARRRGSVGVI